MTNCNFCGNPLSDVQYLLVKDVVYKSCSNCKGSEGYIISEIRFLPMSKSVFPTYEEVEHFIIETMPSRGGTYYYMKSRMDCPTNTFVLFQSSFSRWSG